jgi:alkylation response protein AidB-like acyl-CoA dehydrogenase
MMVNQGKPLAAPGSPGDDRSVSGLVAATATAFAAAVESGRLDLPLPGGGRTYERWASLAELAGEDLSLARLSEGHTDALAILAELGAGPPPDRSRWGVWAAQPPGPGLTASQAGGDWRLDGIKRYCSGARSCTHALVTAGAPDGTRLFAVSTGELAPVAGTWPATGMAGSDTLDVEFTDIAAEPVGEPGGYTARPGFAHGGAGVAACWYGGARAVGQALLTAAAKRDVGPHALAHLGAVDLALHTARDALERAAGQGWDMVLGTVTVTDWEEHPPHLPALFAAMYGFGEGPHPHVHGANLGLRASAYLAAGGFKPLRTAENHALMAAATEAGCQVLQTSDVTVETSARRRARAPRGFSHALRTLARQPADNASP